MDTNAPTPFAPFLSIPILHNDTREGESIRMNLSRKAPRLPPPVEILSQSGHGRHSSFVDDSSMISGELAGLTDLPGSHGQHWEKKFKGFLESASVIEVINFAMTVDAEVEKRPSPLSFGCVVGPGGNSAGTPL